MAPTGNSTSSLADNLSFGFIAQVLPFLALFGEDATRYYLAQAVDWPDYLLFAIGPLGVIFIISTTFRILGTQFLKSKLGRGHEESALIEKELLSSTSFNTCELWNGVSVDRSTENGQIQGFWVYKKKNQDKPILKMPEEIKHPATGGNLFSPLGLVPEVDDRFDSIREERKPPNLLLNLCSHSRRSNILALFFAIPFQLSLIVLAVLTYVQHLGSLTKVHGYDTHAYAAGLAIGGTTALFIGLVLCAYEISKTAVRVVWKPLATRTRDKAYLLWLQRGLPNGAPRYKSYIILKEVQDGILESHYRPSFTYGKGNGLVCFFIILCVGLGYPVQVVGVAGMHYPLQITLFGGTVIMAIIRVALRQVPRPTTAIQTHPEHEMDWMALILALSPNNDYIEGIQSKKTPEWALDETKGWWSCKVNSPNTDHSRRSEALMLQRIDLERLCGWGCPATEKGRAVGLAIELLANKWEYDMGVSLRTYIVDKLVWQIPVKVGENFESVEFSVNFKDGGWQADTDRITSALSLWLFHAKKKQCSAMRHANPRSVFCLGSPFELNEENYRNLSARLRFVKPWNPGDRRVARYNKFQVSKREMPRDLIAGFQDHSMPGRTLRAGNYNTNWTLDQEKNEFISVSTYMDCETARSLGYAPAIVSFNDITTLYALHILSAFSSVLFSEYYGINNISVTKPKGKEPKGKEPAGTGPAKSTETTDTGSKGEQAGAQDRTDHQSTETSLLADAMYLERLAQQMYTMGLAEQEDILLTLLASVDRAEKKPIPDNPSPEISQSTRSELETELRAAGAGQSRVESSTSLETDQGLLHSVSGRWPK
ncbi:hypothetical protein BO82DRAFT_408248 [Aspergillus uvarum CBS 121591]|uniref:Uncharacterized protein n=1 Tax=Aspergillus uvarum CBS 121591 TaxID=1448315 RepID=A0A319CPG5_9EURO|nr:hypothetical protein BO82DRAFT_408248 [Aspergillus uvarum CBS 121591]PYH87104.1 hypothetical protein BO82DRAFT_408248 [Aspergillus uvarum CBS 121591]